MIARIRLGYRRIFSACLPVEFALVDDDSAESRSVSADEFRRRMDDDIGAVLDRTDQVGRAEGVVDDDRQSVLMRKLRNRVDIRNIAVRVAESLEVDRLCVRSDRAFDFGEIMRIYKCRADSELCECVGKEIVGSAVDGFLRNDVIAVLGKRLYGIGDRSRA